MSSIRIDTSMVGPLLDGTARRLTDELVEDIQKNVGSKAESEWSMLLDRSIVNPTPYYETQIIRERMGTDVVVHDRGIIYGPWLEGVGSRNATTRFKGYSAARLATQEITRRVPELSRAVVKRWIARMGG